MANQKTKNKSTEIYETITEKILELLETQLNDWNKPWLSLGSDNQLARNATTQIEYRGINQLLLSFTQLEKDYRYNTWLTFKQAKALDGQIQKGSKSTMAIFFNKIYKDQSGKVVQPTEANIEELELSIIPIVKYFNLFNVEHIDNLPKEYYTLKYEPKLHTFQKNQRAEEIILSTGANIEIKKADRAYYSPSSDVITLPLREQFQGNTEPFYATTLHELGHWTGHETRLNRDLKNDFGSDEYAKEELIAELTSAFCCAKLGFTKTITQNAEYLQSWMRILKADSRAIVQAASKAQAAADYIFNRSHH